MSWTSIHWTKLLHDRAGFMPAHSGMSGRLFISVFPSDWQKGIIIWGSHVSSVLG